jgi:hypothetical protein
MRIGRNLAGVFVTATALLIAVALPATASADDITISPSSLPNGQAGDAYNLQLVGQAEPGVGLPSDAIIFDVTQGALPQGMYVDPHGLVEGIPRMPGSSTFTVTAHDYYNEHSGSATYTVTVDVPTDPGRLLNWIGTLPSTLLAQTGCVGILLNQLASGHVVGCF